MTPNSIIITYKTKQFTLDRVNAEGKLFQIGFASDKWGVRIYRLENRYMRVIIEKIVKRRDGGTGTQFMWDNYCVLIADDMSPHESINPITGISIRKKTRWFTIWPMIGEIYTQLKAEIDALSSDGEC